MVHTVNRDLTVKSVLYTGSLEGMVQEYYLDSVGVGTWALGVTDNSGHLVGRYKDNPQDLQKCCDVSVWLMRQKYLPPVLKAFGDYKLNEAQLAAALSFHWNTGAIGKTSWVGMVKAGKMAQAEAFLTSHYLNGGDLFSRRISEAKLFFAGTWPKSLLVPVYPVSKPSYKPAIARGIRMDLAPYVEKALDK